jgi:hypothetical protein
MAKSQKELFKDAIIAAESALSAVNVPSKHEDEFLTEARLKANEGVQALEDAMIALASHDSIRPKLDP